MFDEHTLIFVASKIEISYKVKKILMSHIGLTRIAFAVKTLYNLFTPPRVNHQILFS